MAGASAPSGDGAHPPGDAHQQEARPHYTDQHTVFIRGLGDVEEDLEPGLRQLLSSCGEIKGVRIPLNGTTTKVLQGAGPHHACMRACAPAIHVN